MGKAIYKPVGKAGEYAAWACNYFLGCSNDCDYCYCKKGVLGTVAGGREPKLKKCFRDYTDAFETFVYELQAKADIIRKEGGLFFSFSSDPFLPETTELTVMSVMFAAGMDVPCSLLTKCAAWLFDKNVVESLLSVKDKVAIGFTLTGRDDLERGKTAGTNAERILAMKQLHEAGFKTFVSLEPVIDIEASAKMLSESVDYCDLYKIGLLSGKREYKYPELSRFVAFANAVCEEKHIPVYWKKSVLGVCMDANKGKTCVGSDYSLFENGMKQSCENNLYER